MLVDNHGEIKSLFFVHLFYGMTNGIFVSLFNFVSLFMFILYLILCILNTKNACTLVHLQIDVYIYLKNIYLTFQNIKQC